MKKDVQSALSTIIYRYVRWGEGDGTDFVWDDLLNEGMDLGDEIVVLKTYENVIACRL